MPKKRTNCHSIATLLPSDEQVIAKRMPDGYQKQGARNQSTVHQYIAGLRVLWKFTWSACLERVWQKDSEVEEESGARALAEELFSFLNIVFGSSLRPAFFFGSLNFVRSAGCDHDRMRGCLPLRCLPLSLQLPGARGDWVPQLGFQELVWRLRCWAVDSKLGSRKLTSQTPKLKLKM